MVRRVNRGSGNALGIIGVALTATYWKWILLFLFLVWLALWAYLLVAGIGLMWFIINKFDTLFKEEK